MRSRILNSVFALSLLSAPAVAQTADLDAYAKAIDANPDDEKAYEAYGAAAIGSGKLDDAITRLKLGVARLPSFPRGYYLMAVAYRSKQAWADAADYYRVYTALRPSETDPYFGLGKALAGMGDVKGAATAFRKYATLELRPEKKKYVDAALAEVARLEGSAAPATPSGSSPAASPSAPSGADASALKAQAESLKNAGRFDEAAAAYQQAIAADPKDPNLYNDLGNVYFALKRYGDAADKFKDATARDGNYAIGWYNLANALRKADRKGEAVDAYRRYIALQANDPDPWFGMAQTLKGLGDTQGAIKAYHRYLEMETRPEQAKWVEKAKAELAALEGTPKASAPGGKLGFDEKSTLDQPYDRATTLDPFAPAPQRDADEGERADQPEQPNQAPRHHLRDLHNPFGAPGAQSHDLDELMNPFDAPRETTAAPSTMPTASRVRDYGKAVAAYRRALAAHVEDVSVRYERGAQQAIAGRHVDAIAAWNTIALDDARIVKARDSISRFRGR